MRPPGQSVANRYTIERHIGSGGMGEVYLAHDDRLGRRIALKLLPPDTEADPVARERLRREALAAAALDHPFICKILEVGEAGGESFIVMEFVEGETLHALAKKGLVPIRQVLDIAHALAQALDAAHSRGFTHRDLKPSNIMVTGQGHVKVLDFGLAKQAAPPTPAADSTGGGTILTDPGTRVGTPGYMSPEQILGGSVDPRSDVFSLGVVLHELVSGVHPFIRETPGDTMAAVLRDPPSTAGRDLEAVPGLGAVIQRMLAKACAERYQTMRELRAELESLRERSWLSTPSASAPPGPRAPAPAERTPFVARETELDDLRRSLDQMLLGQGSLVLIGGEPGVGKTRLVRELQREGRQRGCMSLTGHCYEMEGQPPFVPFVEYMEEAARLVPQAFRAALGDVAGEIATIVPGLRRMFPDIPPAADVPADQQRRVLFNAFLDFLQRGTRKSPSVILFDDLHWADEPTLQLLQHLAPHIPSLRTLVVGTYRDVELDVTKPFARTLEALVRQRLARRITLRRLVAGDVEEMLTKMSGSPAPSSVVRVVFQESEGNPFFIEEVYAHLAEEGRLFTDGGAWRDDLRAENLNVPESVRLVIGRRLERLGDEARKILTAAAVVGRTFPLDLLQAIVEASEDAVLTALEEAERANLLAAQAGRDVRYGFVHELIRTTLVNGLSLPRRQRLHLRIADAIERTRANAIDANLSMLAHHLYQAGAAVDVDRAAHALAGAAQRALASGGFEEALETSDNLLSLELAADHPLRPAGLECRGQALIGLRRRADAMPLFDEAYRGYDRLDDVAGIERTTVALGNGFGWSGDLETSRQVLDRGLDRLPSSAHRARLNVSAHSTFPIIAMGELAQASALLDQLEAEATRLEDAPILGQVLVGRLAWHRLCLQFLEVLEAAARGVVQLPAHALWQRADVEWEQAYALYYLGRFDESDAVAERAEPNARRVGHQGALWALSIRRALIRMMRSGDLPGLLAEYQTISNDRWDFVTRIQASVCRVYLGRTDEALADLRELARSQNPRNAYAGMVNGNLLAATALTGDVPSARGLWDQAAAWLPVEGAVNSQGRWEALQAMVSGAALIGDRDRLSALDQLAQQFERRKVAVSNLSVGPNTASLTAALTANACRRFDEAREHFEAARRVARDLPNRILEPNVEYWSGRFDLEQGRRDQGLPRLRAAVEGFTACGMVLHRALAERALQET